MARRILVTGPVNGLDRWLAAARAAGWEAVACPLLRVEGVAAIRPEEIGAPSDWICVTSANALPALRDLAEDAAWRAVPCAVVGTRTAERTRALGFSVALDPAANAAALAETLAREAAPGARVLWPRGDRAQELGALLRASGLAVTDPVVYRTVADPSAAPGASDAVLFASPSAVGVWTERVPVREDEGRIAVAIGTTTLGALEAARGGDRGGGDRVAPGRFAAALALRESRPEVLTELLRDLPAPGAPGS